MRSDPNMNCPECQVECPAEFAFCPNCGTPLQVACPKCGFRVRADFRFCPNCATPLGVGQPEAEPETQVVSDDAALSAAVQRLIPTEYAERLRATRGQVAPERRTVTILFCDVKGSTAMAEDLDPEDVLEIMRGVRRAHRAGLPLRGHAGPVDGRCSETLRVWETLRVLGSGSEE
jgi:hypothetical protein